MSKIFEREKPIVGITHGDINGIGYEVIIKTLMDNRVCELCTPVVYGSAKIAAFHRKALNIANFSFNMILEAEEANPKRPNMIDCVDEELRVDLGKPSPSAGQAAFQALEKAVEDLLAERVDVLVTAPINKKNIVGEHFRFPGHTEYLAMKAGSDKSLMLMVAGDLRVGVATGHVPLAKVAGLLTPELIAGKLALIDRSLREDFNIGKGRIAVLGLNPHASDEGTIGDEEARVIEPGIELARRKGILAVGPFGADGFFGSGAYRQFDAVLAMYHDQGLVPFKALVSVDGNGVNFTAGLPFVRTSPAHGTAYEIAGQDKASPDSLREAIYLACDIARNRARHLALEANALPLGDHS